MRRIGVLVCLLVANHVWCSDYELHRYFNRTDPADRQLYEFKLEHPKPIGILTTSAGKLVEIRETVALNSDAFMNPYHVDILTHTNDERIPERVVHAKGGGAFGYFEVTHDVSKYTKADVFNGVGKKTPLVVRFSSGIQNSGGVDSSREMKGFAVKFYTKEGNLDFLCIHSPVYFYKNPIDAAMFTHIFKRNPKTNLIDNSMRWDFITKKPDLLHGILWILSDYGLPNGYRKMDGFAIHTFELHNKHGDKYFVKFNLRSEQGLESLPTDEGQAIGGRDPDYFNRDLYDAIENKNYPSWKLSMDVMTVEDLRKVNYDPFDITRLWKKGTYFNVPIGRLVLNRNPDNYFRVIEMSGFNPGNLVPGIPGPADVMYRSRLSAYRDTQVYRLGVNHNRIEVNKPWYSKVYERDGVPPVKDNMKDAPNYYPNSFDGPVPYVDPSRPKERYSILQSNAVDLEPSAYFYNHILQTDDQRDRLANNTVLLLISVSPNLQRRALRLLTLTDLDLGTRVAYFLQQALESPPPPPPRVLRVRREKYDDSEYYERIVPNLQVQEKNNG